MKPLPAFLFCVVAAGCASAPPQTEIRLPFEAPSSWEVSGVSDRAVSNEWWSSFGSTQLESLIREALRENHDLKAAVARLDAAEAQARIAGAELIPQIGAALDSRRQQQVFVGLPIPGAGDQVLKSRSTSHTFALSASWEVDLWGRIRSGRQAATAEFKAAQADIQAAQLSLAARVAKAWIIATEAAHQLELAKATAKSYNATSEQVRERYQRGIRSSLDLRLSLTSESNAHALVAQREREVQTAVRQLEILIGRYPSGKQDAGAVLPEIPADIPAGLPSELLMRRPDLVSAERRLTASRSRIREAKAGLFPRISLTASGGRSSSDLSDLSSAQFNVWALAGNFAQPIFEGGRLRNGVKLAQARERELLENYYSTVLRAFGEVEVALVSEETLNQREIELAKAAAQSESALKLAEDRYRSGLESFVTLLEAQRRALEANSQALLVRRLRLENRVDLHLALGGSFEHQSTPPIR